MENDYDAVIAGGGPSGSQMARDLSSRDYDVLVLEAQDEIDGMKQSTGGTFPRMMAEFGIPDDVTMHQTDKVVLESQNEAFPVDQTGYVLEFGEFKEYLMEDAQDKGAEYLLGSPVLEPVQDNGEVQGVRYKGDQGIEEVSADITVDATGDSAILARDVGLWSPEQDQRGVGVEYEMEGLDMEYDDHMLFGLDTEIAPGGYYWIFHTGEDTAKVGLCWFNGKFEEQGGAGTLEQYLDEWIEEDPRLQEASKKEGERHAGSAYVGRPESLVSHGFMAVGDSVSSIDPVWGEGIHKCMQSGRSAAIAAESALEADNTSEDALSSYEDLWRNNVAGDRNRRTLMADMLYSINDERFDQLLSDLGGLGRDELRAVNDGDFSQIGSLMKPSDLKLIGQFAPDMARVWADENLPVYSYQHNQMG